MNNAPLLYVCGISHEDATPEQIGACATDKQLLSAREADIAKKYNLSEIVLLNTCNRVEYYFIAPSNFDVREFCAEAFAQNAALCKTETGAAAIAHLFEVASGLRSQMTGETEILGQVKAAYSRAFADGHCKSVLNTVFQKAAHVAKIIRTQTDIGHGKISIGGVSAELAQQIFDDISAAQILVIGSGEAGKFVSDALYVRGAREITVVSRTREHADKLAAEVGVKSGDIVDALSSLGKFDIVVCASSGGQIITAAQMRAAVAERTKPIFLIDLSVPKNVDAACADIDEVFLYDMSDLSAIANANMQKRKAEISKARADITKRATALFSKF